MFGLGAKLLPDIYVPTFEMKVNGAPLAARIAKQVTDISVTQSLDPPKSFQFRLYDPTPELSLIDPSGTFTEGTRIEISMGFVGNTKKLIMGEITAISADFPDSGPVSVELQGFDLTHGLTRGTISQTWGGPGPQDGMADSDIVEQIAADADLSSDVDKTEKRKNPVIQNNVSNLDFLTSLAHQNNFFLWVDDTTLYFRKEMQPPSEVTLERGKTLLSFTGRFSTAGQVGNVEVRGWDAQKQSFAGIVQRSDIASLSSAGQLQLANATALITDAPVTNSDEALRYAQAIMSNQQRILFTGSGTSVGNPDMQVGTTLTLLGVGRFEGTYIVHEVTHTLGGSGYQTSFQVQKQT
jgi:phage protein D